MNAMMFSELDRDLATLDAAKEEWARTSVAERITLLRKVKEALHPVVGDWVAAAVKGKRIPDGSPLAGEEWTSGPFALMRACNGLIETLSELEGKAFLDRLKMRQTVSGQLAVTVTPHDIWDRLLLSGIKAEVWMQKHVMVENLADHVATLYDTPLEQRQGKVALVLGAGNIAAIAPLDCFQKLFLENQVVLLKLNPVNDYLLPMLTAALKPLIDRDALRIVTGGGAEGGYLSEHPLVSELHITGAGATHDAIVWGRGEEAAANRKAGTPKNNRRFTSELGAVCPTIVVPGPWSKRDIRFQAENLATQKMHNSGFNCVACQVLILPSGWRLKSDLMRETMAAIAASSRPGYYPGADDRLADFAAHGKIRETIMRKDGPDCIITNADEDPWFTETEIFAPAMSIHEIDSLDVETYLREAIAYANDTLHGTLGANILIHPTTRRALGKQRFEALIAELRYGTIAINAWTGLAFLLSQCPWGAFPGHTPEDVQSGIGTVHNSYMFSAPERTVIEAPWEPFPWSLLSGRMTLLPKPPWFITNKRADRLGRQLTEFEYRPGWSKIPGLFLNALQG
ncbi:aldehyde dehydrogenase [Martelella limonii]|uniref:aldehyde dehydrogenase n=1 Tax=Martelella limonii TaxID=1647649 RepID=UPI001580314E|nr:aldehyde dehydrogenase [Martelella limonii]